MGWGTRLGECLLACFRLGSRQNSNIQRVESGDAPEGLQLRKVTLLSMTLGPGDTKIGDTVSVFEELEL